MAMKNTNDLTYSQKKYLFGIYKLAQNANVVKSADVAKIVGVSKASTAAMVARLSEGGYIKKEYYGQIELTDSGVKAANAIYTNCIIIKNFLESNVGIDSRTADTDATGIVSHVSETTSEKLVEYIFGSN